MHISLDGYVAGPNNSLIDWITTEWSQDLKDSVTSITANVDEILLGRRLAEGFIPAWESRPSGEPGVDFMNSTPKTVFSSTLDQGSWGEGVRIVKGSIEEEVRRMKVLEGKDMVVYGGVELVQRLVNVGLVDEFYLLTEPVALGEGGALFTGRVNLELVDAKKMECGTLLRHYRLKE
jgi:dihydrofolate reductase